MIQFVRVLFSSGDGFDYFNEIPLKPEFNEIVYVFGLDNQRKLQERGYKTYLIDDTPRGQIIDELDKFNNKLTALDLACQHYEKFIMLDWDMKLLKPLDQNFWNLLQHKEVLMPTYSYPLEDLIKIKDNMGKLHFWFVELLPLLEKWSWKFEDLAIIPNAGFIYVNNMPTFGKELIEIAKTYKLRTNVEEFAMWFWANQDLDQYLIEHEPSCVYGRPTDYRCIVGSVDKKCEQILHQYINSKCHKDIYFNHG